MDELTVICYHWAVFTTAVFLILIIFLIAIDVLYDKNYIPQLIQIWLLKGIILLSVKHYYGLSLIFCLIPFIQIATLAILFILYAFLILIGKIR